MPTVRDILSKTTPWFASRGIPTPQLDAQLLVAHVLAVRRLDLFLQPDRALTEDELARCRDAVKRRGDREPVAYITGRREFLGLEFFVSRDVLVPRPETELLVEVARDFLLKECGASRRARRASMYDLIEAAAARSGADTTPPDDGPTDGARAAAATTLVEDAPTAPPREHGTPPPPPAFADIGTGSGVIAVCLAHALPAVRGWAIDRSAEALAVARRNAEQFDVADRLTFATGDLFALDGAAPPIPRGELDLVVSNPPYVGEDEAAELAPELAHEPRAAIFAGTDGLAIVRRLVAEAAPFLRPGGLFACEIGWRQGDATAEMLRAAGWVDVAIHRDLAKHERVVTARRRA